MTRKPLTVVDVTKLDWKQLNKLFREGFDVYAEMISRPEGRQLYCDQPIDWSRSFAGALSELGTMSSAAIKDFQERWHAR